jgi:hypothetical protein
MATEQPLTPQPDAEEPRPSAEETLKKYAIRTGIVAAFFVWFFYDGWFNPEIQAKTFNKVGTVILGIGLIFCLVMVGSAGLVVLRERRQKTPPSP